MLIVTIVLVVLIIGGILLDRFNVTCGGGVALAATFGLVLVLWLLIWVMNYSDNAAGIQEYKAVQQTVENSRQNGTSELERATLIEKIVEENEWLAGCNYWNGTFVGDMIPDDIATLEPIQ
jgi:hypothetical protein